MGHALRVHLSRRTFDPNTVERATTNFCNEGGELVPPVPRGDTGGFFGVICRVVKNETFHTNPKRERGNSLKASITLRVSISSGREQYICRGMRHSIHPPQPLRKGGVFLRLVLGGTCGSFNVNLRLTRFFACGVRDPIPDRRRLGRWASRGANPALTHTWIGRADLARNGWRNLVITTCRPDPMPAQRAVLRPCSRARIGRCPQGVCRQPEHSFRGTTSATSGRSRWPATR